MENGKKISHLREVVDLQLPADVRRPPPGLLSVREHAVRRRDQQRLADQARGAEAPGGARAVGDGLADVELPDLLGVVEVGGGAGVGEGDAGGA